MHGIGTNMFRGSIRLELQLSHWKEICQIQKDIESESIQSRMLNWLKRKRENKTMDIYVDAYLDIKLKVAQDTRKCVKCYILKNTYIF